MYFMIVLVLFGLASPMMAATTNMTIADAIMDVNGDGIPWERSSGPWGSLLEDWTLGHLEKHRQERIILPNTQGYYISNRVDNAPSAWSEEFPPKVANRPSAQYSNYPPKQKPPQQQQHQQQHQQPIPVQYAPVQSPARKEVSETDLYLLGAIEKLVYRVDFMEKRLRKAEELIYYLSAGSKKNPEPCPKSFMRAGANCYSFVTTKALDWKSASNSCKELGGTLAEMETIEENQDVVVYIQANIGLRGKDYWTGGLNPGLLWIWSNSARPVSNGEKSEMQLLGNATSSLADNPTKIRGNGRCLKLAYSPTVKTYSYMGHDCAAKQNFICEIVDKSLSNDIQRISRNLNL